MDSEAYDAAILAALEGSNEAATAYPYGVHDGNAPQGVDVPHLVIMVASDSDSPNLGDGGVLALLYLIRGVGRNRTEANTAQAAALRALYAARPLNVPGYIELRRSSGAQRYEDGDGFSNAAAYYRLTVQYTGIA